MLKCHAGPAEFNARPYVAAGTALDAILIKVSGLCYLLMLKIRENKSKKKFKILTKHHFITFYKMKKLNNCSKY